MRPIAPRGTRMLAAGAAWALAALAAAPALAAEGGHGAEGPHLGSILPLWSIVPFVGILLSIALFPLLAPHWWHRHFPKVSAAWAVLFAVPFLVRFRGEAVHEILHIYLADYIPFIILLWALYTIAGGIFVRGTLSGSPRLNVLLLLIGTLAASLVGTTGASMILIRPVLRANAWRRRKVHTVIFFIFLVSNIGGSLTPLGDPPLFLGFLHGVPFFWTLHLAVPMLIVVTPLLFLYWFIDHRLYVREEKPERTETEPLRIDGLHNLLFLGGVMGAVLLSGIWHAGTVDVLGVHMKIQFIVRDLILLLMGLLSLRTTREEIHRENEFTWFPIQEVAYLFAGIFMTIIPALTILKAGEAGALHGLVEAVRDPAHFFWITGSLSSFLDNAPTYLTFFNTALGRYFPGVPEHEAVHHLIREQMIFLEAISTGAVFMGAMTYIGNAPNFMVRSIAEEMGVAMPSFFGYLAKWSIPILIPVFTVLTLLLYR